MFDIFEYAKKNNVEVSVRRSKRKEIAWEFYLKDRERNLTEYGQVKELELRGHSNVEQEAIIKKRMDEVLEKMNNGHKEEGAA